MPGILLRVVWHTLKEKLKYNDARSNSFSTKK